MVMMMMMINMEKMQTEKGNCFTFLVECRLSAFCFSLQFLFVLNAKFFRHNIVTSEILRIFLHLFVTHEAWCLNYKIIEHPNYIKTIQILIYYHCSWFCIQTITYIWTNLNHKPPQQSKGKPFMESKFDTTNNILKLVLNPKGK